MSDKPFQSTLAVIEGECQPLLMLRTLRVHKEQEWWGAGIALENPGRASLRIFADFRDQCVDVNFMNPEHLAKDGMFIKYPHFDSPYHRFGLWEVLRARGLEFRGLTGAFDPSDEAALKRYVAAAVTTVIEHCLDILDGDLSVTNEIARLRHSP